MKRSSRPRAMAELSKSIHQQLNMYALAATGAGVTALALAQPADAKIVYTPAHVKLAGNTPFPLDLNHDGVIDFFLLPFESKYRYYTSYLLVCHGITTFGTYSSMRGCSSNNMNPENAIQTSMGRWGAALRPGARIQRGDRFRVTHHLSLGKVEHHGEASNITTLWYGPWMNGGKGVKDRYLGIRFAINGRLHFGWARMTITRTRDSSGRYDFAATLTGYAYETIPGKVIVAGKTKGPDVVIEPATLGHLAAGASATPAWRVKRTAATTH